VRTQSMRSVAVVDRDQTNCMLLREICLAGAWRVAGCALDVDEGLALVTRSRPGCLVTEYKFDGPQTGLDLIARAKRLAPDLFTVMLTAWDINDIAGRVTTHQPDRILRKPVAPHVLMDVLDGWRGRIETIRIDTV
jgi:CheY-like chemotaxis protein